LILLYHYTCLLWACLNSASVGMVSEHVEDYLLNHSSHFI